jgi:hypothetical protein
MGHRAQVYNHLGWPASVYTGPLRAHAVLGTRRRRVPTAAAPQPDYADDPKVTARTHLRTGPAPP